MLRSSAILASNATGNSDSATEDGRAVTIEGDSRRCVVLGATGFLGTNLVHALCAAGWQVRAFGLPGSDVRWLDGLPVELVFGDVTNPADVDAAVQDVDVVFHVAGDTSFWKRRFEFQRRVNVDGVVNTAESCIRHGVKRMVLTSTIDALGYNPDGLADETWPNYNYAGMGYNYADTKRDGERRALIYNSRGLEVVVIYPGSMLGPYDFTLQFGRLFMEVRDGQVPACPKGGISFGHVREVAQAHIAAALRGTPGEGYICAGTNATYRELIERIARKLDVSAPKWDLPESFFAAYGFFLESISEVTRRPPQMNPGMARFMSKPAYYDSSKAVTALGYQVVPLDVMVEDAYRWYQENGFL